MHEKTDKPGDATGPEMLVKKGLSGITFSIGRNVSAPLVPSPTADQANPRRSYVYAHVDPSGRIFYIGYGTGRRAWSRDRHPIWFRYVEKHLNNQYSVLILQDNLTPSKAEELESEWAAQTDGLVNWQNMARQFDLTACDLFHSLRDANRALIQQAKVIEKTDLEQAAQMYIKAIEAISGYAFIKLEGGLVGQLLDEEAEEFGTGGEVEAIDRLTMCLIKLGRASEAIQRSEDYFNVYRRDRGLGAFQRVEKRLKKAQHGDA